MRPLFLLFSLFVASGASLIERDCGSDPDDCEHGPMSLNSCKNPKNASEQKGIERDLLDNLRFFSEFAAAA